MALEYSSEFAASTLSASDYSVADRTITKVYTNSTAQIASAPAAGKYVIVELSADDSNASISHSMNMSMNVGTSSNNGNSDQTGGGQMGGGQAGGGQMGGGQSSSDSSSSQVVTVTSANDSNQSITTTGIYTMIADEFEQFSFTDSATGMTVPYNLFTPKNLDKSKKYPLVVFVHDSSVVSDDVKNTLYQGLGAICWASPEDQAANEAFVLAPNFTTVIVDDTNETTDGVRACMALIDDVVANHNIDTSRIYATGQSMGGMTSIAMNIERPNFFASSYLVACQWDTSACAPLAKDNLWITVSEGDDKAFPGQNEITALIESLGTPVTHLQIQGNSDAATYTQQIESVIAKNTTVNYTTFAAGTLPGLDSPMGMEHMCTWRVAYSIPEIRRWIMSKTLST